MPMIVFEAGNTRFNYRVAGVALRDNEVLLNRLEDQDYWFLPGGRVEMGETSVEALAREMQEEVQAEVQVTRLVWVAESFFIHRVIPDLGSVHELAFYYLIDFPPDSPVLTHGDEPFPSWDGHTRLVYQWFPLAALDELPLYPPFLIKGLQQLPEQTVHILDIERRG